MKGTEFYYEILFEKKKEKKNCCSTLEIKLGGKIDRKACLFTKTKKIPEIKLRWFQIRLLDRILPTSNVLKETGITQGVLRHFCNLERDSLQP